MFDYAKLIDQVWSRGPRVDSRMGQTHERLGLSLTTIPGYIQKRVGFNKRLGYMELAQLLAGTYRPDLLGWVAPRAQHALFTPQMAYGPRVADQLPVLVDVLRQDPGTRQAVLFVGRPDDGPSSDLPCTLTIQFLRREGSLRAIATMRSWDLVKGLPYDLMMFGGLQMALASVLGDHATELVVQAGSAHVYESDSDKLPTPHILAFDWRSPVTEWSDVVALAVDHLSPDTWQNGCPPYLVEEDQNAH